MSTFKYRAQFADGRMQAGLIQAEDLASAEQALQERGMQPLLIEPYRGVEAVTGNVMTVLNRIHAKDLVVVSRALSVMVSASVPLTDALRDITRQTSNPKLRIILQDVANDVEGGGKLSDALERYPKVFSGFFVHMVRSGETSGQLAEILEYLADQQEKDYDLGSKIRSAMIYPAFILSAMLIVGFVMMTFVVPKLVLVLKEANVALPLSTRILISLSGFFENYWWVILCGLVALVIGVRVGVNTPYGRYVWDALKIRVPIFGKLFQRVYVVRFSRSLATLVKGGVDLIGALEVVAGVMENEVWKRLVLQTIQEVNDGNSLTTVFERQPFVPSMMTQMLAVGESTGRTQEILMRLSAFYSREIDNVIANLVALIEPIVLIMLGVGVGMMVSAILLPLYSLTSAA